MRKFLEESGYDEFQEEIPVNELGKAIIKSGETPTKFKVNEYNFPILSGVLGNRELISKALGTSKEKLISFISKKIEKPQPYSQVKKAGFLDNQIEMKGKNLSKYMPLIPFHAGKKYLSSSIVIVDFPEENRQNASFHRMMHLGGNRLAIRIIPQRHLDKSYTQAIDEGEELKVSVVVGVHPAVELACAFSYPRLDELELASAFVNGLKVFQLSNGIKVPANAEFVMEARITGDSSEEGPFVDLTGTADKVREQPVLEVDKLYFRNNPLFRTLLPGGKEHRMLMGIPQEPRMFSAISNTIPTVKNVVMSPGGGCWLHAIVQIKKRTRGDGKNAIMAALAAHPSLKRVIIIDEDIDPSNPVDMEWAVATRVQPDKNILFVPGAKGSSLDPSSDNSITCKWGIDATKPLTDNEGFEKVEF